MPTRPMSEGQVRHHCELVSRLLARHVETGGAPWMRSFDGRETQLPIGLGNGRRARGMAAVWLAAVAAERGWRDPRWCTWETARTLEGGVVRGQRATLVLVWQRTAGRSMPLAAQPHRVFNAQQCWGLPEWEPEPPSFSQQPARRARAILRNSGAALAESPDGAARYDPRADRIELPPESAFGDPEAYLRTALHELGHWTGHPDRLARDSLRRGEREGRGSEDWAREELRAEIASMMTGHDLELGHDPARHAVYRDAWIQILQRDPLEIAAASREAQQVCDSVLRMEREPPRPPTGREPEPGGPGREERQTRTR